jgi:imidazole glycerol-phosphate synthase subunit HisH
LKVDGKVFFMTTNDIVIMDIGVSNLFSVKRAFEVVGANVVVSNSKKEILDAPKLILPGVGAFKAGIQNLKKMDLVETIIQFAGTGKPLLGICLGMQLLLSNSEENGLWNGLDLVKGKVKKMIMPEGNRQGYKIPQIGWNCLIGKTDFCSAENQWNNSILQDVGSQPYLYFIHSYHACPENPDECLAYTHYGRNRFCSVIQKENIMGCQFHPERSGVTGLKILENFLHLQ